MDITLYSHQEKALDQLSNGKILCGGTGSGKSRTALAYYYYKICGGRSKINGCGNGKKIQNKIDLYIITTARKRDTNDWVDEYAPFGLACDDFGVKVTVDSWNNIKKYINVKNAFFIFDEQKIVGRGIWAKSFIKIARQNRWILLTATPGDIWLDYATVFIANGFYRNRTEFEDRHVIYKPRSKFPQIMGYRGTAVLEKHRKDIIVRMPFERNTIRHKQDVLSKFNKAKLDTVLKDKWDVFSDKPIKNRSALFYIARKVINLDSSRLDNIIDILKKHKRAIIFYNFDYELEILRELHNMDGMVVAEWNGHKHDDLPSGDMWVYLVQYTAGAEGWECTDTDTIIFYSLNYSYKILAQCEGRIDRLNTGFRDLYYYYLTSESIIDKGIRRSIDKKEIFNAEIFLRNYL